MRLFRIESSLAILCLLVAVLLTWKRAVIAPFLNMDVDQLGKVAVALALLGGWWINCCVKWLWANHGLDKGWLYYQSGAALMFICTAVFIVDKPGPAVGFTAVIGLLVGAALLHFGAEHDSYED